MYEYTLIRQHHYICNILYMYNYMFIYSNFQIKIMMHENPEGTWKSKKKKKKKKKQKQPYIVITSVQLFPQTSIYRTLGFAIRSLGLYNAVCTHRPNREHTSIFDQK